jgi:hypothetical protein
MVIPLVLMGVVVCLVGVGGIYGRLVARWVIKKHDSASATLHNSKYARSINKHSISTFNSINKRTGGIIKFCGLLLSTCTNKMSIIIYGAGGFACALPEPYGANN